MEFTTNKNAGLVNLMNQLVTIVTILTTHCSVAVYLMFVPETVNFQCHLDNCMYVYCAEDFDHKKTSKCRLLQWFC